MLRLFLFLIGALGGFPIGWRFLGGVDMIERILFLLLIVEYKDSVEGVSMPSM
jgi:hypothetical protein